jgi:hypothetical protein
MKEAPQSETAPAKKTGMMKWLLMGVAFIVLTAIVSVGTVFIIGVEEPVISENATAVILKQLQRHRTKKTTPWMK